MKSSLIAACAVLVTVAACTSKTTIVRPVTQAPAPAPTVIVAQPPPAVVAAPDPRQVIVTYALPAGFPAAQMTATEYCRQHYGSTAASIVTDDHAGHATFACVS
jgi:hypothetical protein